LAQDRRAQALAAMLSELALRSPGSTMDLALGLAGLMSYFDANPPRRDSLRRVVDACAAELLTRFSPRASLFRGHAGVRLRSAAQARVTTFATQVYPLHGLAWYARGIDADVFPVLGRVAATLVEAQGPLGQWWWFYSAKSGAVLEGYPVYSVHQDAMAFMALLPLRVRAAGAHERQLSRGLDWLFGANELGTSLVRSDPAYISRCIQRVGSESDGFAGISHSNRLKVVARGIGLGSQEAAQGAAPGTLEILHECRSYHLGWILYAESLINREHGASS
jgi:hypothetical protein